MERRLPLLLDRKMGDVVLKHGVLRADGRELLHKAAVAGG
jgi:hypothetical protein